MPEELGTRDVLEQVDVRLSNVEQDIRSLRVEMIGRFERTDRNLDSLRSDVNGQINGLRSEINGRFERQTRWLVGLILLSWLSLIVSIWLKP